MLLSTLITIYMLTCGNHQKPWRKLKFCKHNSRKSPVYENLFFMVKVTFLSQPYKQWTLFTFGEAKEIKTAIDSTMQVTNNELILTSIHNWYSRDGISHKSVSIYFSTMFWIWNRKYRWRTEYRSIGYQWGLLWTKALPKNEKHIQSFSIQT